MHEITDFWIDDYAHKEELERDIELAVQEFLEAENVFHDTDADD